MGAIARSTAILTITFGDGGGRSSGPLDITREYRFDFSVDGHGIASGTFKSPLGDQGWQDLLRQMQAATSAESLKPPELRAAKESVENAGSELFRALDRSSPQIGAFLREERPRRLVIRSSRQEIHRLPWEALHDPTTTPWTYLGGTDLSLVHAETFDAVRIKALPPVAIRDIFGPKVEGRTRASLDRLERKVHAQSDRRLSFIHDTAAAASIGPGEIVHVEAHGSLTDQTVDTGDASRLETELADRVKRCWIVLLWSCHSGFIPADQAPLPLRLHRNANRFVLAFATPLRFETSEKLAGHFYDAVFEGPRTVDPETAVLAMRSDLYASRRQACEWAALTVWAREPIDVEALALDGPRTRVSKQSDPAGEALLAQHLPGILRRVRAGEPLLVTGWPRDLSVPGDKVSAFHGAVIELRGGGATALEGLEAARDVLSLEAPPSAHRADGWLGVAEALSAWPGSLLVWSGAGRRETDAMGTAIDLPSVPILMASPWTSGSPGVRIFGLAEAESEELSAVPPDPILAIEAAGRSADRNAAVALWKEVRATLVGRSVEERARFDAAAYSVFVRSSNREGVKACIEELSVIDPIEGDLLKGNLQHRNGERDEARKLYENAAASSLEANRPLSRARALLELAYLDQDSDLGVDGLFREARALIEGITDRASDETWASALGRVLRDHAHSMVRAKRNLEEARTLLRRAYWIHALDGRTMQVAATLRSAGDLQAAIGRPDRAEAAFFSAARLMRTHRNFAGWVGVVADMGDLALQGGHHGQVVALAESIFVRSFSRGKLPRDAARLARAAATACWREGHFSSAEVWGCRAESVDRSSPLTRSLQEAAESLATGWPSVIAFAGRRIDKEGAPRRFPLENVDRVRSEIRGILSRIGAETVVGSAACGADLIVLDEARKLGMRARIIIPFDQVRFRETSVDDCRGEWKALYESLMAQAVKDQSLDVLPDGDTKTAYSRTNDAILQEAERIGSAPGPDGSALSSVSALVVWDRQEKDESDLTAQFLDAVRKRGWSFVEVTTR